MKYVLVVALVVCFLQSCSDKGKVYLKVNEVRKHLSHDNYRAISDGPDLGYSSCFILHDTTIVFLNQVNRTFDVFDFEMNLISRKPLHQERLHFTGYPSNMFAYKGKVIVLDESGGVLYFDEFLNPLSAVQVKQGFPLSLINIEGSGLCILKEYNSDNHGICTLNLIENIDDQKLEDSLEQTLECSNLIEKLNKALYHGYRVNKSFQSGSSTVTLPELDLKFIINEDVREIDSFDAQNFCFSENTFVQYSYEEDSLVVCIYKLSR